MPSNEVFSDEQVRFRIQKSYYGFLIIYTIVNGIVNLILSFVPTTILVQGIMKIVIDIPQVVLGIASQLFIVLAVDMYAHDSSKSLRFKRIFVITLSLYCFSEVLFGFLIQGFNPFQYMYRYMMIFELCLSVFSFVYLVIQWKLNQPAAEIVAQQVLVCCCHTVCATMQMIWGWMLDAVEDGSTIGTDVGRMFTQIACQTMFVTTRCIAFIPVNTLCELLLGFRSKKHRMDVNVFEGNGMKSSLL